jgi:sporulation protein YlmC with PRC-barrel domain
MILSDVLRSEVVDAAGHRLGRVADVRFRLEGPPTASRARITGIIVSPRTASSFMGYERSTLDRPVILDRLLRFIHRGSFLVDWDDIQRFEDGKVRLRKGYERRSATLPGDDE